MGEISFTGLPEQTHHCTSYRDGDWIVWKCPQCQRYERRLNARTGEMKVSKGGSEASHAGSNTQMQNLEALTKLHSLN